MADLNRAVGHPPATTMRSYLKTLADLGVVERRQEGGFPGTVTYSLTPGGERLLEVASALQSWLKGAPDGPIGLGTPAAKSAIQALVEGWNATIVRVLAARPLTLTELAKLITSISYPTLERRLAAMRRTGQLQSRRNGSGSRGTQCEVAPWLRRAVGPLVAAVAWERECAPVQTRALSRIDIEALFLLALPLLDLPEDLCGRCRLAVEVRGGLQSEYAGVTLIVEEGRPPTSIARLEGDSEAWVVGTVAGWLDWLNGRGDGNLELGGESGLARVVVDALRPSLFSPQRIKAA